MTKFTNTVRNTLAAYFETGDKPTEAQFSALITAIQEGIEEHDHAGVGDGDANRVAASGISNRVRTAWVSPTGAYSYTAGADIDPTIGNFVLPDSALANVYGRFRCPADYASGLTAKAYVYPATSGDVYVQGTASYEASGESSSESDGTAWAAVTLALNTPLEIASVSLSSIAIGDNVLLSIQRNSTHASDTMAAGMYVYGFVVSYTADS